MNATETYTYDLATFSAEGTVPGPGAQRRDPAVEYVAQRMADQHRGGLTIAYWRSEASRLIEDAQECPGIPRSRLVLRGRGVSVIAHPATVAAAFRVELFPIFDDEGPAGPVFCAAATHPRLSLAMAEAGMRAEHWLRHQADAVSSAEERGPVVGFEVTVDARLLAPLRALPEPAAGRAAGEPPLQAA
jgi:hypothetical protein